MLEMEAMGQRYLFKLRQTAGVKRLIERPWPHGEWHGVGQGFDAVESQLRRSGWSRARRVVVRRRRVKDRLAAETHREDPPQALHCIDRSDQVKLWEYAVLVTNADDALEAMGQPRSRAPSSSPRPSGRPSPATITTPLPRQQPRPAWARRCAGWRSSAASSAAKAMASRDPRWCGAASTHWPSSPRPSGSFIPSCPPAPD